MNIEYVVLENLPTTDDKQAETTNTTTTEATGESTESEEDDDDDDNPDNPESPEDSESPEDTDPTITENVTVTSKYFTYPLEEGTFQLKNFKRGLISKD